MQVYRRARERVGRRSCAALAAVALSSSSFGSSLGCSFALSGPKPDWQASDAPDCDRSKGAIALDGVWVGVAGVAALTAFANGEAEVGAAALAVGAIFLGAAIRGNGRVDECRAADRDHVAWLASQRERERVADEPRPRRSRDDGMPRAVPPAAPPPVPTPPAPAKPATPPEPAAKPPTTTDEWDAFWQEVP